MTTANIYFGRKRLKEGNFSARKLLQRNKKTVFWVHAGRLGKKETSISKRMGIACAAKWMLEMKGTRKSKVLHGCNSVNKSLFKRTHG